MVSLLGEEMETDSIRGRSWADVAEEIEEADALAAEQAARCAIPASPTFGDFLVRARRLPGRQEVRRRASLVGPRPLAASAASSRARAPAAVRGGLPCPPVLVDAVVGRRPVAVTPVLAARCSMPTAALEASQGTSRMSVVPGEASMAADVSVASPNPRPCGPDGPPRPVPEWRRPGNAASARYCPPPLVGRIASVFA